ncbi:hypothetical protein GO001_12070 [Streptomyces sp. NRRL B-1677]|uniref:hypothetical protein n=1 Tax=Streptomyces sp. NRRL B-1677 TaxID=2682966 RepID=UPI0018928F0D|nr:hypothetical protein [Streptomyces sp. NRRL B-1677]MBF6045956.1 hypothetical protein [Streptomyces sp. NRRL B-1677]
MTAPRTAPPGRAAALAAAILARRTCPTCRQDAGYCIPVSLGECVTCAYPEEQRVL